MLKEFLDSEFFRIALKRTLPVLLVNKFLFFCVYKYTKNPCVVDVGYTVGHFLAGITYAYYVGNLGAMDTRIKLILLAFWTARLAGFLTKYRVMRGYKDPRYEDIFKKYPQGSYQRERAIFGQYIFQAFIVLITSSPLYWTFKNRNLNIFGILVAIFGISMEAIAGLLLNQQLQNYKDNKQNYKEGHIFCEGLWQKSRHPNLFFELLTWTSFSMMGVTQAKDLVALIGPFTLYLVMDKLTVPITESYLKKSRGDKYIEFMKKTNKFLPF